ncbi:MAG: OmpA family protein [Saprospiraceae bacterium]
MDKRLVIAFSLLTFFHSLQVNSQPKTDFIRLQNSSFEDIPRCCQPPSRWQDIGANNETPPDIQPGSFNVNKPAKNGNSYLGMVVRDNDTREGITQKLVSPLKKGYCYRFSLWLCRSELYLSQSPTTKKPANYITPAKLALFGGSESNFTGQLLSVTEEVTNSEWKEYVFEIKPKEDFTHLTLCAQHKKPLLFPYNGNILVDYASDLVGVKCDDKVVANNKKTSKPETKNNETPAVASTNRAMVNAELNPAMSNSFDRKKLKVGQTIRIEKLFFDADSTNIRKNSLPVLDELLQFMQSNPDVKIEVGGHSNDIPSDEFCDRLSTSRAKAVADYLILKGIRENRVQYKGYGKRQPLFPNLTSENRKRNQRVEIKILSIG